MNITIYVVCHNSDVYNIGDKIRADFVLESKEDAFKMVNNVQVFEASLDYQELVDFLNENASEYDTNNPMATIISKVV